MKTKLLFISSIFFCFFLSCEEKVDTAKEATAIKAVFEAEKEAYLKQDNAAMGTYWVQDQTSQKIWHSATGERTIIGWEDINASQLKEVNDNSWDRKQMTCTFSDFKIDIMDESAWVTSNNTWKGVMDGKPFEAKQSRISVMKQIDGKWKFALMAIYNFPMDKKDDAGDTTKENK